MFISFRWSEGSFDGNRPVLFSVQITENEKPFNCSTNPNENGNCILMHPTAKFTHLTAFTTYKFTVCSINSIGRTCTDDSFDVTTLEAGVLRL